MNGFPENLGIGFFQQVWLFSGYTGYNALRLIGYPSYLTFKQQARLERIRQARMLHDGRHFDYFLWEGRTQFDFPEIKSEGRVIKPFVPLNLLKLISLKSADVLFGAEPSVKVEDEIQSQKLADLTERTALHKLLYHTALEASYDGEAAIEAVIQNGQLFLKRVDIADIIPEGHIQPDGQYPSYVRYNAKNAGDDKSPKWLLLTTRYLPGKIVRTLQELDSSNGSVIPPVLTMNRWPQEDPEDEPIEPETITGIDRNTITWIPNLLIRDMAVSDYDGLVETQDLLNVKRTQLARVLAQHADPAMAMPTRNFKPDGTLDSENKVFPFDDPHMVPQYITWNAELAQATADFLQVRGDLLLMSETSPILLGIKDHATAHVAYKSVRLEATNTLTKAQRKAVIFRSAIKRMLSVAQDLEQTIPGERYDRLPLGVEMQDGLPVDTDLQATEIATKRGCGVMSVEGALEVLLPDPVARAKELARLEAEKAAATPTILMAPPSKPGDAGGGAAAEGEAGEDGEGVEVED